MLCLNAATCGRANVELDRIFCRHSSPPQSGQCSRLRSNTRLSSLAQLSRTGRWRAQFGPGGRLCLGDEGHGVLPHQAVQRGLLRAVTLVVDPGATRRPLGLLANGLQARLPRL